MVRGSITEQVYKAMKSSLDILIGNAPEMKPTAQVEFNNFLICLDKKTESISAYVNKQDKTKSKIIKAPTKNFVFTLTINPDNSCSINLELHRSIDRSFSSSFLENRVLHQKGFVYFVKSDFGIKIGCTKRLQERLRAFAVKLPFKTELIYFIHTPNWSNLELMLHRLLAHKRIDGEWFNLNDDDFVEIEKVITNLGLKLESNGSPT